MTIEIIWVTAWTVNTINAVNHVRSQLLAGKLRTFYGLSESPVSKALNAGCVGARRLLSLVGPYFMSTISV